MVWVKSAIVIEVAGLCSTYQKYTRIGGPSSYQFRDNWTWVFPKSISIFSPKNIVFLWQTIHLNANEKNGVCYQKHWILNWNVQKSLISFTMKTQSMVKSKVLSCSQFLVDPDKIWYNLFNWNSRVPKVIFLLFVDKIICSFTARPQRWSIWPNLLGSTVMSALKNGEICVYLNLSAKKNGWKCVCLDLSAKKNGWTKKVSA